MDLSIIFEDENFVAINKPYGLLVHRTKISEDTVFALQLLRDKIGQKVFPVHRIDRPTSGVLIFGKSSEAAQKLALLFREHTIEKEYLAVVRGFVEDSRTINSPLKTERAKIEQEAITHFTRLDRNELPFAIGKRYKTARFSFVSVKIETGRTHQIRRHFSHIRHPIIGDVRHGDVKQNKYFKNELGIERMLLHAKILSFKNPYNKDQIIIEAELDKQFSTSLNLLGFN